MGTEWEGEDFACRYLKTKTRKTQKKTVKDFEWVEDWEKARCANYTVNVEYEAPKEKKIWPEGQYFEDISLIIGTDSDPYIICVNTRE